MIKPKFNWILPAAAFLSALLLILLRGYLDNDLFGFVPWVFAALITSGVLLYAGMRCYDAGQRSAILITAVTFSVLLWMAYSDAGLRSSARWLFKSHSMKEAVLACPRAPDGTLQHAELEATGFAGVANNTTYAVYDPTDRLAVATHRLPAGMAPGLPCEVWRVDRLERHWYSVLFYTDTEWDDCNYAKSQR